MLTIKVIYDADKGIPSRDGDAENIVDDALNQTGQLEVFTANASVVDAFRVAVKEKRLNSQQIIFVFKTDIIHITPEAQLSHWPRGFCDHTGNRLRIISTRKKVQA